MVLDNLVNFSRGAVDAAVASGDTTISVVDASEFADPSTAEYDLVIWDAGSHNRPDQDSNVEVVRVTARDTSNDNLTVTRGQQGTSAASHPSSSELIHPGLTQKMRDDLETSLTDLADYTASPTEVTAPVNNSQTTTNELSHNPDEKSQSLYSAVSDGLAVAIQPEASPGMKSVDASNFADHSAAIQALADWIDRDSNSNGGTVFLPHTTPGGGAWQFTDPVRFGTSSDSEGGTTLVGVGFTEWPPIQVASSNNFSTSSDDAIFEFYGNRPSTIRNFRFRVGGSPASLFYFNDNNHWIYNVSCSSLDEWFSIIDSGSFEWSYQNIISSGGKGIKVQNSGSNRPGKGHIQDSCAFLSMDGVGLQLDASDEVWWNGNWEGGSKGIEINNGSGPVHVGSSSFFYGGDPAIHCNSGTSQLYVDDNTIFNDCTEGIRISASNHYKIGYVVNFNDSVTNDIINVQDTPSNSSVLPNSAAITGSVTYPSSTSNVYEMDATQL